MSEHALFPTVKKSAIISADGVYRYELRRIWGAAPICGWIMLNPSMADADVDDPTIRRCVGFAKAWGYGGIVVRNLYALRATDPKELWKHRSPAGTDNDSYLLDAVDDPVTVCAWGAHGRRGDAVINALSDAGAALYHLGLTKAGKPRHPLYLRADLSLTPFGGGNG
jgi:hypothetical protein